MSHPRVLIVEADAALASAYRGALLGNGLAVDVLADVDQAVEQSSAQPPDLLVLDVDPSLGDIVCRKVKKKNKRTPVLLVAANANGKRSLFGAHPDVILQKPVSAEALLRSVASLLGIPVELKTEDEIPLDESLLEIVEEARPKDPPHARFRTPQPEARMTPPPIDLPPRKPATQAPKTAEQRKEELASLREVLKKRSDKPVPAALPGDRMQELEAERGKLHANIEDLRVRTEQEAAARGKELLEVRAALAERDETLQALRSQPPGAPELEERARKAEEERDKVWAELVDIMPRAESAAALGAELEALRAAIAQREEQLRERDGRLAERDAMLADRERRLAEVEAERRAAQEAVGTAETALEGARAAQTEAAAKAAERAASPVFARERELLDTRRALGDREKQILDLRGEIEQRERAILDRRHETLEVERKGAGLAEQMLALEQTLLAANEKNAQHEREIERQIQVLDGERQERERERERAGDALAAAGAEHERRSAEQKRAHADEIATLRETEAAERAELEARMAARIEAMRRQAQEQLAAAEGRRQADLAGAETRRQADLAAAAETRQSDLEAQAARNAGEMRNLAAAHEQRLADLIREYEGRLAEQEETFRDQKLGTKQRHAAEIEELAVAHAARVGELEARISELDVTLVATQDQLAHAHDRIENDRLLGERARKALAVALALLEEQSK